MASLGAIIGWLQLTYEPPPEAAEAPESVPSIALKLAQEAPEQTPAASPAPEATAETAPPTTPPAEATPPEPAPPETDVVNDGRSDDAIADGGAAAPDEAAAVAATTVAGTPDTGRETAVDTSTGAEPPAQASEDLGAGPAPTPETEPQTIPTPADDGPDPAAESPVLALATDQPPDSGDAPAAATESTTVPTPPAVETPAEPAATDTPAADSTAPDPATLAWRANSRPFQARPRTPRIAIVLWGLGLSKASTSAAIQQLPGEVTLAFAPYGRDLQDWADQARAAGHEVLLQLPMEPESYPDNDPGPHTLLTSLPVRDNLQRLDWLLDRFSGYVGVTNYMGSRFTTSERHLRPVLKSLRERGLLFLDSRSAANSVAGKIAAEMQMAHALNNRYIDNEASRPAIDARLLELERLAEARGYAVGIGFPYPVTIERVAQWARTLERKGVQLAPLSAVVGQPSTR